MDLEIPFDRVTWRPGQRLSSRDLTDNVSRATHLRWLHNRHLHGAAAGNWGIVEGFDVRLAVGGRAVGVSEGYAVDALGRELILSANIAIDVRNSGPLHFALARALHDRGHHADAFAHYREGNRQRAEDIRYDPRELTAEQRTHFEALRKLESSTKNSAA